MSDNWIAFIPRDINSLVDAKDLKRLADEVAKIAPNAEELRTVQGNVLRMFDCGSNLETVECPACDSKLDTEWWHDQADEGYDEDNDSFDLRPVALPCCGHRCTLNDLRYDFDQGFSRWGVDVMNPDIGELDDATVKRLEEIVGCKLRVVYQHL